MFGKYFKQVLVLTLLAGFAYSLPQVKEAMVGAFSFSGSNDALVLNYNNSSTPPFRAEVQRPPVVMQAQIKQPERREISPEEIVAILVKAGVITNTKATFAVKVLKEHFDAQKANASSTRPFPPLGASTTPPFGSSTRPMPFPRATSTRPIQPPVSSTTSPRIGNREVRPAAPAPVRIAPPVQDMQTDSAI